jgi:hypothetical protein
MFHIPYSKNVTKKYLIENEIDLFFLLFNVWEKLKSARKPDENTA